MFKLMKWKYKGLNELMTILILIAIAIPVAFLMQSWLSSQASKTPELPEITTTATSQKQGGSVFITLTIFNNGKKTYSLIIDANSPRVVLNDGTVISPEKVITGDQVIIPSNTTTSITLGPKSATNIVLYFTDPGKSAVSVMINVSDETGAVKTISINVQ